MMLVAKLAIACMLLTGISFGKDRRWNRDIRHYSSYDDYSRYGHNDERYGADPYRNSRYNSRRLPPGIQKKLRRGGSLPPGHAGRLNRDRYRLPGYYR